MVRFPVKARRVGTIGRCIRRGPRMDRTRPRVGGLSDRTKDATIDME